MHHKLVLQSKSLGRAIMTSFHSPVVSIFIHIANLLLIGGIASTTGKFTATSQAFQVFSAVTGVLGYSLY